MVVAAGTMLATADPLAGRRSRHALPVRVYYEDTDAGGIVYYANYLKFAERARTELLRRAGLTHGRLLREHGIAFVVRHCTIDFRQAARLDDQLIVHSRLTEAGRASLRLDHDIEREGETIVTVGLKLACVNAEGRAVRMPPEVRSRLVAEVAAGPPQAR